ncbi:MAG: LLM class F420-dependent oxidoreductase [Acidimicrobiales bacterium]
MTVIFGAFVPQGWKMELSAIEGAEAKWATTVATARLIEDLGYDSLWVYDHFHNIPRPSHEAVFESWTTLTALSQLTSRVRLGHMVGCNGYRNPALVAKMAATVDVISGGRLEWGIRAGWYAHEFAGYGYEFPEPRPRLGMLAEAVRIVRSMWTEPDTSFEGRHYRLRGGQCDPKPLQQPHPPIWIGGSGEHLTLRVVARYADYANFGGNPEEWAHKAAVLKQHCAEVGRDYDEIGKTWTPEVFIREDEADLAEGRPSGGQGFGRWQLGNLVGTPEQVAEKVAAYVDMGCTGFIPWCPDYPSDQSLRLLAEKVMPEFR